MCTGMLQVEGVVKSNPVLKSSLMGNLQQSHITPTEFKRSNIQFDCDKNQRQGGYLRPWSARLTDLLACMCVCVQDKMPENSLQPGNNNKAF